MSALSFNTISALLEPYAGEISEALAAQLGQYLDLLLKWNARTNLTAIREPEEIVRRHFGESLFCARHLPLAATLLDLGSGAGFPGLPVQLAHPSLSVVLAESQNKKASFLREVVRSLDLKTEVWAGRAEAMPEDRHFDIVTLRAVDNMAAAMVEAKRRAAQWIAVLTVPQDLTGQGWELASDLSLPNSHEGRLVLLRRTES